MSDMKPEALQFADDRPTSLDYDLYQWAMDAEEILRTQHAEIQSLTAEVAALSANAHDDYRAIERKDALLRQALDALCLPCDCSSLELSKPVGDAVDAIIKELSQ